MGGVVRSKGVWCYSSYVYMFTQQFISVGIPPYSIYTTFRVCLPVDNVPPVLDNKYVQPVLYNGPCPVVAVFSLTSSAGQCPEMVLGRRDTGLRHDARG